MTLVSEKYMEIVDQPKSSPGFFLNFIGGTFLIRLYLAFKEFDCVLGDSGDLLPKPIVQGSNDLDMNTN
ncbi:Hypothetical protein CINCED_3A025529 [Cinara cedri]|uniref:Uncharacterized protein n=1 Tax=Cinara cedri TaxID=506608 RepID=A0A5E4MBJ9_9HEMI|nr:Hypothetical protein CINCED_3A025529 [Cinara cedri]